MFDDAERRTLVLQRMYPHQTPPDEALRKEQGRYAGLRNLGATWCAHGAVPLIHALTSLPPPPFSSRSAHTPSASLHLLMPVV